jgi:membrane associated rhomboid family serine protease
VEAQTDIQTYLEQGKQALAQGQGRDAAIAYAHAAQVEPDNPMVHLGLAEANLALGSYGVVQMACRRTQELQPTGGLEGRTAQAILDLLDRRYERALQHIDMVISEDPSIAYAHALRSYLLRVQGQDYDANLARARAARLSYGGRFENCFPAVEPLYNSGYKGSPSPTQQPSNASTNDQQSSTPGEQERRSEPRPAWTPPNQIQRQIIRTRFTLNQYPGLITNILIAINVIVFVLSALNPQITNFGAQANSHILQGEYWRLFTAMFLHDGILHIALNMFSLFFIGRAVEVLYGKGRYLLIYLIAGICGGLVFLFLAPPSAVAVGASGAIFGVFGALGIFLIVNRRALGPGMITNWLFWLGLNLVFGLTGGVALWAHIGGLVAGIILGFLLLPRSGSRRFL